MEIWKDVVDYEGIYEVSNTGKIRTHKNKTTHSEKHGIRKWKQRILKQKVGKDRCCRVELYKNKIHKTVLVHRIVAYAFLPVIENKNYINHKDGNRLNNHIDNLEWCNHVENNNHAFDTGLVSTAKKIAITNKVTGERNEFRSMQKASYFLGKNHGFVSRLFKNKKEEFEKYQIKRVK